LIELMGLFIIYGVNCIFKLVQIYVSDAPGRLGSNNLFIKINCRIQIFIVKRKQEIQSNYIYDQNTKINIIKKFFCFEFLNKIHIYFQYVLADKFIV